MAGPSAEAEDGHISGGPDYPGYLKAEKRALKLKSPHIRLLLLDARNGVDLLLRRWGID